jgi:predicted kinase
VWLSADPGRLLARVGARAHDASDATADVVRAQLGYAIGAIDWAVVDAAGSVDDTVARTRAVIGLPAGEGG